MTKRSLIALALALAAGTLFADAVSNFEAARASQEAEEWYSAIELYQEALRENPSFHQAYRGLAECFYALDEYDHALAQVKKAQTYRKNDPELMDLEGFILVGIGKLAEAQRVFSAVLSSWPNDVGARFGSAEIEISAGRVSAASARYLDALKRQPENRKALLSLALVSWELGNAALARDYASKALQYHGDSAQVHYFAGYLASLEGRYGEAEGRARAALRLQPRYDDAQELLASVLYRTGRYAEVVDVCDERIARDRSLPGAWYLRSLALRRLGKVEEALRSAQTGLQVAPEDEVFRAFAEGIVLAELPFEDARRGRWAAYHVERARVFEQKNLSDQALYEYRRALKVNPYDVASRRAYAKLLLTRGYPARHLDQLKFIQTLGKSTSEVNDAVENYEKLLQGSLPKKWKVDPLYLDKSHARVGLYYQADPGNVRHPDAERVTVSMVAEVFSYDQRFTVSAREAPVSSYAEAFRASREAGEDYFALVTLDETERDVRISLDLYVSRTGSRAEAFSVFRTGNDRYANALRRLVQTVASRMPVRGAVLARYQADAIIDLGRSDGVAKDQIFDVVPRASVRPANEGLALSYPADQVLASFTVTALDEDLSQGILERSGYFDRVNAGDAVIPRAKEAASGGAQEGGAKAEPVAGGEPFLLNMLRKIR